jgi:hypothetical protein
MLKNACFAHENDGFQDVPTVEAGLIERSDTVSARKNEYL